MYCISWFVKKKLYFIELLAHKFLVCTVDKKSMAWRFIGCAATVSGVARHEAWENHTITILALWLRYLFYEFVN